MLSFENYLLDSLEAIFNVKECSDTILNVNGEKIYVRRRILSNKSVVFSKMFNGSFVEGNQSEIIINDPLHIDVSVFKIFLLFLYTGQIKIEPVNVFELIYLANQYDITILVEKCSEMVKSYIDMDNLLTIWNSVLDLNIVPLNISCLDFFIKNFDAIKSNDSTVTAFSTDIVKFIVTNNNTDLPELYIFQFAHQWITLTKPVNEIITSIINEIRLSLISMQDLVKIVRPTGLIDTFVYIEALESFTLPIKIDSSQKRFGNRTGVINFYLYHNNSQYIYDGYRQINNDDITPNFVAKLNDFFDKEGGFLALNDMTLNKFGARKLRTSSHRIRINGNDVWIDKGDCAYTKNAVCPIYDANTNIIQTKNVEKKINIGDKMHNEDRGIGIYVKSHVKF